MGQGKAVNHWERVLSAKSLPSKAGSTHVPSSTLLSHATPLGQKEAITPSTAWGRQGQRTHKSQQRNIKSPLVGLLSFIGHNAQHPQGSSTHRDAEQPAMATLM